MSWKNHNTLKLARLLKTTSPNLALGRCLHLTSRRNSSALIDMLKSATTVPPHSVRTDTPPSLSSQSSTGGSNAKSSSSSAEMWGSLTKSLQQAANKARENTLTHSREPPESLWKWRSEQINSDLRTAGMTTQGPRVSLSFQAQKKGPSDTVGLSEAEVPFVASGRTVTSGDFGRAIIKLNQILSRNRVRQEWRRDKYFTKPFELRYQLRSQRHRKRFAAAIRRKVQIVQAIKRRGM